VGNEVRRGDVCRVLSSPAGAISVGRGVALETLPRPASATSSRSRTSVSPHPLPCSTPPPFVFLLGSGRPRVLVPGLAPVVYHDIRSRHLPPSRTALSAMIGATRRWFQRNRKRLAIGFGVVGAGYLVGQYVLSKISDARERMSSERIAREKFVTAVPILTLTRDRVIPLTLTMDDIAYADDSNRTRRTAPSPS